MSFLKCKPQWHFIHILKWKMSLVKNIYSLKNRHTWDQGIMCNNISKTQYFKIKFFFFDRKKNQHSYLRKWSSDSPKICLPDLNNLGTFQDTKGSKCKTSAHIVRKHFPGQRGEKSQVIKKPKESNFKHQRKKIFKTQLKFQSLHVHPSPL